MVSAFVLQTHKNPAQIRRLAMVLRRACPGSVVVVSHDRRSPALDPGLFDGDERIIVTTGSGGRGDFLILDGYLAALKRLEETGLAYDWVTNLSGQDYPVASLRAFEADLAALSGDGYLHHFDVLRDDPAEMAPMRWPPGHGFGRYWFQYAKLAEDAGLAGRLALYAPRVLAERLGLPFRVNTAYGIMIGHRALNAPFGAGFRCHAGSYWHTISRRAVRRLLAFCDERPDVVSYFRRVLIPDESFVQTVLVNDPNLQFVPRNRRYFDMSASRRGHPKSLGPEDVAAFSAGDHVFARKIEPDGQAGFLDMLDARALS